MMRFTTLYGAKFTSMVTTKDQIDEWKHVWSIGLQGMNGEDIAKALDACIKKCPWPPTPAEFRDLINEEIDYEKLFIDASNALSTGNYTPLAWHAAAKFGRYELRHAARTPEAMARFKTIVDSLRGHSLSLPEHLQAKQLPAPGQTFNRDVARSELEKAKAIMRGEIHE